jgi:formamidopyrimidine-DNA glycosylase
MPELPEVEVIRQSLADSVGRHIVDIEVRESRLRKPVDAMRLRSSIGQQIVGLDRKGKYLIARLSDHRILVLHFGMSGTVRLVKGVWAWDRHDHVQLVLDGDLRWVLNDPRRFGLLWVGSESEAPELSRLGPDALSAEFTAPMLFGATRRSKRAVKNVLLDQRVVAGVGNIYANEALFLAGIRPSRAAHRLSRPAVARLHEALRATLREAIAAGGSSIADFHDGRGRTGYFQLQFRVYDRCGEPCLQCGGTIRRAVHAGRSSFYCPRCQH